MKNRFLGLVLSFVMGFYAVSPAFAAVAATVSAVPTGTLDYNLPYPGILPDHPLYKIKLLRDRILMFVTKDPIRRVNLQLLMSDKQLVMGQLLWEKGKNDLAIATLNKSEKDLLTVVTNLVQLKKTNTLSEGLADKVELAAKKHEETISKLVDSVSDNARKKELGTILEITHQAIQQVTLAK